MAKIPLDVLMRYMPKKGMMWTKRRVTSDRKIDNRIVRSLESLGVPLRKKEVQRELCSLVELGRDIAIRMGPYQGRDIFEFWGWMHTQHRLGQYLAYSDFVPLCWAICVARLRYKDDRISRGLVVNPVPPCELAQLLDALEVNWDMSAKATENAIRWGYAQNFQIIEGLEQDSDDDDDNEASLAHPGPTVSPAAAADNDIAATPVHQHDPAFLTLARGFGAIGLGNGTGMAPAGIERAVGHDHGMTDQGRGMDVDMDDGGEMDMDMSDH
ncbi:hypothetical protein VTJ49DRAFT_4694 [Mycothermus thermophilus]|uniref:Uncharacterized protein n=1 Tax=Humicola insolens TaxID=85995 RepID=A0ABR3V5T1_HUMIN